MSPLWGMEPMCARGRDGKKRRAAHCQERPAVRTYGGEFFYMMPFSRRCSCHLQADFRVSAREVSAFHPNTVLAFRGSAHTWVMSP